MSFRRRTSESCSHPRDDPGPSSPDLLVDPEAADISLVRSDSLSSLSSGGDSDGGPAEPTPAEISILSASIDARNVEAARVTSVEAVVSVSASDPKDEPEVEEVTPVFPAGFHRLPSAMRPPVRRGHVRSASAGGNFLNLNFPPVSRTMSNAVESQENSEKRVTPESVPRVTEESVPEKRVTPAPTEKALPSALKASVSNATTASVAARSVHKHHRRVFSHGHITFGGNVFSVFYVVLNT